MVSNCRPRSLTAQAPGSITGQSICDLWWIGWHCERYATSSSTSVFPCQYHSANAPYSSSPWYYSYMKDKRTKLRSHPTKVMLSHIWSFYTISNVLLTNNTTVKHSIITLLTK
jgi:hypothetical protein